MGLGKIISSCDILIIGEQSAYDIKSILFFFSFNLLQNKEMVKWYRGLLNLTFTPLYIVVERWFWH